MNQRTNRQKPVGPFCALSESNPAAEGGEAAKADTRKRSFQRDERAAAKAYEVRGGIAERTNTERAKLARCAKGAEGGEAAKADTRKRSFLRDERAATKAYEVRGGIAGAGSR